MIENTLKDLALLSLFVLSDSETYMWNAVKFPFAWQNLSKGIENGTIGYSCLNRVSV